MLLFIVEDLFILLPAYLLIVHGGSHFPLLIPSRPRGSMITLTFHFISCSLIKGINKRTNSVWGWVVLQKVHPFVKRPTLIISLMTKAFAWHSSISVFRKIRRNKRGTVSLKNVRCTTERARPFRASRYLQSRAGGLVMFKRLCGAAKALSAAYQITWLMGGLSGLRISTEKRKDKLGGALHSLSCHSKIKLLSFF